MEQNKLTNQERARIFAMYLGQKVFSNSYSKGVRELTANDLGNVLYSDDKGLLNLSELQDITDEDAIEVADMLTGFLSGIQRYGINENEHRFKQVICYGVSGDEYGGTINIHADGSIIWDYENKTKYDGHELRLLQVYDYLRENSYALPFKGQDLFELGIAINKNQK